MGKSHYSHYESTSAGGIDKCELCITSDTCQKAPCGGCDDFAYGQLCSSFIVTATRGRVRSARKTTSHD